MKNEAIKLIDKLSQKHSLSLEEYLTLIEGHCPEVAQYAAERARQAAQKHYGRDIYIRGLIEVSNFCKNDCLYCGIRRSNKDCSRYRLTKQEILSCCRQGYELGFRTFVLQGGEDPMLTDSFLCDTLESIKALYPDCAVTLSLGEREKDSYKALFSSGADRYLLRHETANKSHYESLHPEELSFDRRLQCLYDLKEIGYQVGCGFMVGSPFQKKEYIAEDLKLIEEFSPDMCGIGPFITHKDTPFRNEKNGDAELTVYLLSLIRLIKPNILLPATTALGTLDPKGREKGVLAGANVVMPNLSPLTVREKYMLYDNKIATGQESAQCVNELKERMKALGYNVVYHRGDIKK